MYIVLRMKISACFNYKPQVTLKNHPNSPPNVVSNLYIVSFGLIHHSKTMCAASVPTTAKISRGPSLISLALNIHVFSRHISRVLHGALFFDIGICSILCFLNYMSIRFNVDITSILGQFLSDLRDGREVSSFNCYYYYLWPQNLCKRYSAGKET